MLTPKDAADMVQQALKLSGNVSATISADRCQNGTRYLNRVLATMSELDSAGDQGLARLCSHSVGVARLYVTVRTS